MARRILAEDFGSHLEITAMKGWKVAQRELFRKSKGFLDKKKRTVRGDVGWGIIWQQMGQRGAFELREKWLTKAGWDTSWLLTNWNELPHQLKLDLVNNEPKPEDDFTVRKMARPE